MIFNDLCQFTVIPSYKEYARNEWLELKHQPGSISCRILQNKIPKDFLAHIFRIKDDVNAIGYMYIINELYNKGIKVVKPSLEQCLAFENIEINIPFEQYKQPYETILVEFPDDYKHLLRNRYKRKAPLGIICHRTNNYMIGGVAFGASDYNITFFITHNSQIIEELIDYQNQNVTIDPDYLPLAQAERVAFNIMLFMTNFGSERLGYENLKQHRFRERKQPEIAKQDFYYYGINQNIKLYNRKVIKGSKEAGHHASPIAHWRRGHWRLQHHGEGNLLTKTIFIAATFVCGEDYKGNMSDTKVTYQLN